MYEIVLHLRVNLSRRKDFTDMLEKLGSLPQPVKVVNVNSNSINILVNAHLFARSNASGFYICYPILPQTPLFHLYFADKKK